MPVIDVDKARAWAKERWPSPVVRRHVDDLLAHCPRAKEIPVIHCERCKHSEMPAVEVYGLLPKGMLICRTLKSIKTVWADSTCDDAEEREETP